MSNDVLVTEGSSATLSGGNESKSDLEKHNEKHHAIGRYWSRPVSIAHADLLMLCCSVATGLCDAVAFNTWDCFVSMQTGNTVFLALGASGQPIAYPDRWLKSLVSIASFLMGCLIFSFTRYINPTRRGILTGSFLVQAIAIFIAAALEQSKLVPEPLGPAVVPDVPVIFLELVPISLLAFQFGGQILTSRLLGLNEMPTNVLTSVYCDFISDPKLLQPLTQNVSRNRRFGTIVGLLGGAIAGGWLSRSAARASSVLWIAGFIKVCVALSWALLHGARS